jgi:hypothetical protein
MGEIEKLLGEIENLRAENAKLRTDRDRYKRQWERDESERDALSEKLTEMAALLEEARDRADAAWDVAVFWREARERLEAALAEERQGRDALTRLEADRLTGRAPGRRGRPPSWSADGEAEVERLHRAGSSVRQIAADLHTNKSQIHRVITRVRRRQAEAAERARLTAIATGLSPAQRAARVAKQAAEHRPIEDFDPVRAERGLDRLLNPPVEDTDE